MSIKYKGWENEFLLPQGYPKDFYVKIEKIKGTGEKLRFQKNYERKMEEEELEEERANKQLNKLRIIFIIGILVLFYFTFS